MTVKEQQQLGKTLWGIADKLHGAINDELICTQSRKLETLEAHKEGMIRQMFPTMVDFARRATISIENPTMADFARRANISIENKITNNQKISVGDSYQ